MEAPSTMVLAYIKPEGTRPSSGEGVVAILDKGGLHVKHLQSL